MLLYEIITIHPFVDGNKRTALEAADTLLRNNGKSLQIKDIKQAGEYIISIAENKKNIFSIENWIKTHCDWNMIRPEVIKHAEESMKQNAELLRLLASEEISNRKILQREQTN